MKEVLYIILLNIALGALKFLVIFGNALSNFINFHDNKFLVGALIGVILDVVVNIVFSKLFLKSVSFWKLFSISLFITFLIVLLVL